MSVTKDVNNHVHEHTHDHPHEHFHTHEHSHGEGNHSHGHAHVHSHDHDGHGHIHDKLHSQQQEHKHSHDLSDEEKETFALLRFMLSHNRHHADELGELAGKLVNIGRKEAAGKLSEAISCFEKGNLCLEETIGLIEE